MAPAEICHDGYMTDSPTTEPSSEPDSGMNPGPDSARPDNPTGAENTSKSRSLTELRRSEDDRMLAGVCAGIARHFDIDPTVVRVVFVVLTFVGLSGIILYGAFWLLVPTESRNVGPLGEAFNLGSNEPQFRNVGFFTALVLAAIAVLGNSTWGIGGWAWGLLWASTLIAAPFVALYAFITLRRKRRDEARSTEVTATPPQPDQPGPVPTPPATAETTEFSPTSELDSGTDRGAGSELNTPIPVTPAEPPAITTDTARIEFTEELPTEPIDYEPDVQPPHDNQSESQLNDDTGHFSAPGSSTAQPTAVSTAVPTGAINHPAPKRTPWSPTLLFLTLGALAINWGVLWIINITAFPVDPPAYAVSSLAIIALGLLVGSKFGDAGILIPIGLIATAALAITSVFPHQTSGQVTIAPLTVAELPDLIEFGAGELTVDLSQLTEEDALDGESLTISSGAGQVRVILPPGVEPEMNLSSFIGVVSTPLGENAGIGVGVETLGSTDDAFAIRIDHNFGLVEVMQP